MTTPPDRDDVTKSLVLARSDSPDAAKGRAALFERLYTELHALADHRLRAERPDHTLSPTALVHEIYLRLVDEARIDGSDRARFLGIAARAMRQVLVDHARARGAAKRGGVRHRVTLDDGMHSAEDPAFDAIAFHDALEALSKEDERAAVVTEMHVFAGMTFTDIAEALGVSRRTVNGDWAFARRWLSRAMDAG